MNLNKIKEIIELPLISEADKESLIINEISKDENVVPIILQMLNAERIRKNELVSTMNLLLSKADVELFKKIKTNDSAKGQVIGL